MENEVETDRIELCYGGMGDGRHSTVARSRKDFVFLGEQMEYHYVRTEHKTAEGYVIFKFSHITLK